MQYIINHKEWGNNQIMICPYYEYIPNTGEGVCISRRVNGRKGQSFFKKIIISLKINPYCKHDGLYCPNCKYLFENRPIVIKNGKSEVQW